MIEDMGAVFYAWGPDFKSHMEVKPFENLEVYPLITTILKPNYTEKIDGTKKLANEVLK